MKNILVIGNGFDLDLGLRTRYSDFAKSNFWKYDKPDIGLNDYLYRNKSGITDKWLDLEMLLGDYSESAKIGISDGTVDENRRQFDVLKKALADYLLEEQKKTVDSNSIACKVLKSVIENEYFEKIYSFNYTDLSTFAKKLNLKHLPDCVHVHGSLKWNSTILGIEDGRNVANGLDFFYKTSSKFYRSLQLSKDLLEADSVVFFGVSMGQVDFPYFQDFFKVLCSDSVGKGASQRHLFFLTYDDKSHQEILSQIRKMNKSATMRLFSNDASFIFTEKNEMQQQNNVAKMDDFVKYFKRTSKVSDLELIYALRPRKI